MIASEAAIDQLNALATHGVTIAIDDFGTGYSALTTLRSLPVKIVKIDKSFVAGSTVNAEDRAVTEAVVKMAAQMGMRTIAEGVERLDQQKFLESIGADAVQGYLYLRPTPRGGLPRWLATNVGEPASRRSSTRSSSPSRRGNRPDAGHIVGPAAPTSGSCERPAAELSDSLRCTSSSSTTRSSISSTACSA